MSLTPVPVGNDIPVSTGDLRWSTIEALANGGFVVVWASNDDTSGEGIEFNVYAQLYSSEGAAVGSAFLVNTTTDSLEAFAAVATLADGGFIVIWSPVDDAASPGDIYGQRYTADGTPAGDEFVVNTVTDGDQYYPSVTGLADGGFVVAWSSFGAAGDQFWGVYGQRFAADGAAAGEFHVNTTTAGNQYLPSVAALKDGSYVITWSGGPAPVNTAQDIFGQRYGADGNPVGAEFTVNTFTTGDQRYSSVTGLVDGGFVVTWSSNGQDGSGYGIYGQRYAADGSAVGGEFKINTFTTGDQIYPSATALADGGFVVTWSSNGQDGSSYGVYGQRFATDGTAVGSEFRVNQTTVDSQLTETFYGSETVAALQDGDLVATWIGGGVFARLIDAPALTITTPGQSSIAENDTAVTQVAALHPDASATLTFSILPPASGGAADGALFSIDSANGSLSFLAAPDYELPTDAGVNNVYEVTVRVTDNHGLFDDQVVAITVTDVLGVTILGTESVDVISANSAPAREPFATVEGDTIFGFGGNDMLDGGAGADQMQGGQDNDTYVVDNAGDVVTELASQGTDTVQTTLASYTLGANVENLTFTNNAIHVGFGNGLANVFTGSDGDDTFVGHVDIFEQVADTFNGGNGNDTFIAEFSDIINGGAGTDFLFAVNSNPWNINLGATSIEWMSAGFGSDTINAATQTASVEVFAGGGNDTVTGSAFDDFLWLGAGNDTAVGGNGNDMLFGDIGADSLTGGDGNDNFYVDSADTLISGGNGVDNMYWTEAVASANINMATSSLEWAQTQGGNDTLNGATGAANLEVYAGGGTDIITGGSGNDFLWGEGGNDTITGNGGSDTLVGGTGADTLTGGAGLDTLYANSGNGADGALDTFVFTNNWGTDFVYDFENGTDKFDMTALGTNFGALTVTTVGAHAQVSLSGNLFIVVNGAGQIDATDFLF